MKKKHLTKLFILSFVIGIFFTLSNATISDAEEELPLTTDMCTDPIGSISIQASDDGVSLSFNPSEVKVDKGACVTLKLTNPSHNDHDFDMRKSENPSMQDVHLEFPLNDSTIEVNLLFPNQDTELILFCGVTGHRAAGMVATIVVGSGNSGFLPGLGLPSAIIAFLAMVTVIPIIRRKSS